MTKERKLLMAAIREMRLYAMEAHVYAIRATSDAAKLEAMADAMSDESAASCLRYWIDGGICVVQADGTVKLLLAPSVDSLNEDRFNSKGGNA